MTRLQKLLGVATIVCAAWGLLGLMVPPIVDIWEVAPTPLTLAERLALFSYTSGLRYAPFFLLPVLLAPVAVTCLWLVPYTRPKTLESAEQERLALGRWLAWLTAASAIAITSVVAWNWVALSLKLWCLMTMAWSYAGALNRALRLQSLQYAGGRSRISPFALAVAAGATMPLQPLGLTVPVWTFWNSRAPRAEHN